MRKGLLAFLVFAFLLTGLNAQNSQFDRLEKLYGEEKYEQCIRKALKISAKYKSELQPDFYLSASYLRLALIAGQPGQRDENLSNSLKYASRLAKKTKTDSSFYNSPEMKMLYDLTRSFADSLYKNNRKSNAKKYYTHLAELFNDTTENYKTRLSDEQSIPSDTIDDGPPGADIRNAIISSAEELVGTPYKYTGKDPAGFDCSGFVNFVFRSAMLELPRTSTLLSMEGVQIDPSEALPGDLVFFGTKKGNNYVIQHVAIVYSQENGTLTLIHSTSSAGVIIEDKLSDYWRKRFLFVRRVL